MNENVGGMMIRLVSLALAVLLMAGMTIYTGLSRRLSTKANDTHAAVIRSLQDGHVAAGDVQWGRLGDKLFFKHNTAPRPRWPQG